MNTTLASLPIDTNTLIVLVIAIVSGISSWLEKRRKDAAAEKARNLSKPPQTAPRETAAEPPDMEEILRRLLGGESPPAPPAPPVLLPGEELVRREPVVASREETDSTAWHEEPAQPAAPVPPPPVVRRPHMTPQPALAALPRLALPSLPQPRKSFTLAGKPVAVAISTAPRRRRPLEAQRAVDQLRDRRAARTAFVASLIFAPPKSLDNSQP
jgi:hypothetical protein